MQKYKVAKIEIKHMYKKVIKFTSYINKLYIYLFFLAMLFICIPLRADSTAVYDHANDIQIDDSGGYYTSDNVEDALQEISSGAVWADNTTYISENSAMVGHDLSFANTFFVDAGNNRVGIGTLTPATKLHISEALSTSSHDNLIEKIENDSVVRYTLSATGLGKWYVNSTSGEIGSIQYSTPGGRVGIIMYNGAETSANRFNFAHYGTAYNLFHQDDGVGIGLTIYKGGRLGINTDSPVSTTELRDGLTTVGPVLTLGTKETTVVASDVLGRINFYAPLETDGSDSRLVGGSILAIAEDTFSASVNKTSLQFQTGASETATTKMTILSDGNVGIGTTTPAAKLDVAGDAQVSLDLTVSNRITATELNVGDSGGFSGMKFDAGATTLDFYIDGTKVAHIASDGSYNDDVP